MNFLFTQTLTGEQQAGILNKYRSVSIISAEQYPGFSQMYEPDAAIYYAIAYKNDSICGYCVFQIKARVSAAIYYGPVTDDVTDYFEFCRAVIAFCRKKGCLVLKIHPPFFAGDSKSEFEQHAKTQLKFEQGEQELNWATLQLDLDVTEEELLKQFRENHRRSIKKAVKMGFTTEEITDARVLDTFNTQYCDMYESRNLAINRALSKTRFESLFEFFRVNKNGFFLVVKEGDKIIGGLCIVFQGNSARYLMGYAHPDYRTHPVNHIAFVEAMKIANARGLRYFDFGGYATNVKPEDQLYAINNFKFGFTEKLLVYPQTMVFYLFPGGKMAMQFLTKVKQMLSR